MTEENANPTDGKGGPGNHGHLHIFVNRRKFEEGDGVKASMTGTEIAALVEVPAENAVVRWERDQAEIPVGQPVAVKNGDRFLVTRKVVEGGYGPQSN